jgi:hypothetical protein
VSPDGTNATNRGSRLSGYVGGSRGANYRQVNQGYGKRSDFTLANIKDKGDYNHDYDKMGSFKKSLEKLKEKGTRRGSTFGGPFCEANFLPKATNYYLGRGNKNQNGLGLL